MKLRHISSHSLSVSASRWAQWWGVALSLSCGLGLAWVSKAALAQPTPRLTGVWYVAPAPLGDPSHDCLTPATPCATIKSALAKAAADDTIYVATGRYISDNNMTNVVDIGKTITLTGGWNATFTTQNGLSTLDGENWGIHRIVTVAPSVTVRMDRFALVNGMMTSWDDTTGGGVKNLGTLWLSNSVVQGNYTTLEGGGISNFGTLTLTASAVTNNSTASGGGAGIANYGVMTIVNSTIASNYSINGAGGVLNGGQLTIYNSTITNNSATTVGGIAASTPTTLTNSILFGNSEHWYFRATDCSGPVVSGGYNVLGPTASCGLTPTVGDQVGLDPQLEPLTGMLPYHALALTSPALDHGAPAGCVDGQGQSLMTDQRGLPRANRCDSGAYELQPLAYSGKTANTLSPRRGDTLTYTLTLTNPGTSDYPTVTLTDTLPALLTYQGALTATSGVAAATNGVITWTGAVPAGTVVNILFQAGVNPTTPLGTALTNTLVINSQAEIFTRTARAVVAPFRLYLAPVGKPDPAAILREYVFADRFVNYIVVVSDYPAHITFCVSSVQIRWDGQMKFNTQWTVTFLDNPLNTLCKYSDTNNPNMYVTDEFSQRYDHGAVGGAAGQYTCFYRHSGPTTATGWYLFPPARNGAKIFTFHDDDQSVMIDNLVLNP